MLKKAILLMFVGVVSSVSMTILAASSDSVKATDRTLTISTTVNDQVPKQVAAAGTVGANDAIASVTKGESEATLPATGWLLFITLLGFVALSNRRGI
ncbi:MAG: hypothetical protein WBC07_09845 [Methylotenera sp.]